MGGNRAKTGYGVMLLVVALIIVASFLILTIDQSRMQSKITGLASLNDCSERDEFTCSDNPCCQLTNSTCTFADFDGDLVCDIEDNCPLSENPDQSNMDVEPINATASDEYSGESCIGAVDSDDGNWCAVDVLERNTFSCGDISSAHTFIDQDGSIVDEETQISDHWINATFANISAHDVQIWETNGVGETGFVTRVDIITPEGQTITVWRRDADGPDDALCAEKPLHIEFGQTITVRNVVVYIDTDTSLDDWEEVDKIALSTDNPGDVCDDDLDNDGVSDELDNCPGDYNPDQADTTETGDFCESTQLYSISETIDITGTETSTLPDALVDSNNNLHLIWSGLGEDCDFEIYYKMADQEGETLIGDTRLTDDDCSKSRQPEAAIDENNIIYIVWQDQQWDSTELMYARINPNLDDQNGDAADMEDIMEVEPTLITSDDGYKSHHPHIAIGSNSTNIHVAYQDTNFSDGCQQGAPSYLKINATGSVIVSPMPLILGCHDFWQADPRVAADSDNNAHVTFSASVEDSIDTCTYENFYAMIFNNGSIAINTTQYTSNDCSKSRRSNLIIDSDNNINLIWQDQRGCDAELYYKKINPGLDNRDGSSANINSITIINDLNITRNDCTKSRHPDPVIETSCSEDIIKVVYFEQNSEDDTGQVKVLQLNNQGQVISDDYVASQDNGIFCDTQEDCMPSIAAANGHVYAAWETFDYNSFEERIFYIHSTQFPPPDGIGDVCDSCPAGDDNIDEDEDGIPDACDNCKPDIFCPGRTISGGTDFCQEQPFSQCSSSYQINSYNQPKSCYVGESNNAGFGCNACGPNNEGNEYCENECIPQCAGNPNYLDASFNNERCSDIEDQDLCERSFMISPNNGKIVSCFFGLGSPNDGPYEGCHACNENNENSEFCQNECSQTSYNPEQDNSDSDDFGDLCDPCPGDSLNDQDNDGLCSSMDPCPLDPNNDEDNDGICGDIDNCPTISNSGQTDTDNDGRGDACDNDVPFSKIPPEIDGVFSAEEWNDAKKISFFFTPESEHPPGFIHIYEKHDLDYIYFLADVTPDNTEDGFGDSFSVEIDINNDDNFECVPDNKWDVFGDNSTGTWCEGSDYLAAAGFSATSNAAYDHRFFEIAIPIEELFDEDQETYHDPMGKLFWGYGTLSPEWTFPAEVGSNIGSNTGDASQYMDMFIAPGPNLTELWRNEMDSIVEDVEIADLDLDGDLEVVKVDAAETTVEAVDAETGELIWENSEVNGRVLAVGTFNLTGEENATSFRGVAVGTFNDVTILNALNGSFVTSFETSCSVTDVEAADVNGDGFDDIIWSDGCGGATFAAIDGATGNQLWSNFDFEVNELAVGDLNNDGLPDVAFVSNSCTGAVNGSSGEYLHAQAITPEPIFLDCTLGGAAIAIADMDGNGLNDVISGSLSGAYRIYFMESGNGNVTMISTDINDFEGEPILDIAAINRKLAILTSEDDTIYWINYDAEEGAQILWQAPHGGEADFDHEINLIGMGEFSDGTKLIAAATEDENLYVYNEFGAPIARKDLGGDPRVLKVSQLNGQPLIIAGAETDSSTVYAFSFAKAVGEAPQGFEAETETQSDGSSLIKIKTQDTQESVVQINLSSGQSVNISNTSITLTRGSLLKVTGLSGVQKRLSLPNAPSQLCVLDSENLATLDAQDLCQDAGEFILNCPGSAIDPSDGTTVTCTLQGATASIGPLNNSGIGSLGSAPAPAPSAPTSRRRGDGISVCRPDWQCTEWSACQTNSMQIRTCTDLNNCRISYGKPAEQQSCVYIAPIIIAPTLIAPPVIAPNCNDGIRNQDESDVDCGGVCGATCTMGEACRTNSDCRTNYCENGICAVQKVIEAPLALEKPSKDGKIAIISAIIAFLIIDLILIIVYIKRIRIPKLPGKVPKLTNNKIKK